MKHHQLISSVSGHLKCSTTCFSGTLGDIHVMTAITKHASYGMLTQYLSKYNSCQGVMAVLCANCMQVFLKSFALIRPGVMDK